MYAIATKYWGLHVIESVDLQYSTCFSHSRRHTDSKMVPKKSGSIGGQTANKLENLPEYGIRRRTKPIKGTPFLGKSQHQWGTFEKLILE